MGHKTVLNETEANKVKKECYLMRQDNTIYKCSIEVSFPSIVQGQIKTTESYLL